MLIHESLFEHSWKAFTRLTFIILYFCHAILGQQREAQPFHQNNLPVPLLLPITATGLGVKLVDRDHDDQFDVLIPGDIVLGGLFPIHEDGSPQNRHCGAIKPDKGIQRMEAMLFALDEINKENKLLPGLKLGAHILDTCNQDTHGLEQTLKFIKFSLSQENVQHYVCPNGGPAVNKAPKPVPAVIGAASSQVSAMVANVLRLFKIPQISYSSTSTELSDKTRFTFFSRVVPPDDLQAQAMADVVKNLNWTYVSALYDEGSYGEQGMELFAKYAGFRNICIAISIKIKRDFREMDYIEAVRKLKQQRGKGVIMYVNEDNIKRVLRAVHELELDGYFAWVASDNWGNKRSAVQDNSNAAIGAITMQPMMKSSDIFDEYFKKLNPKTRKIKYKWFEEFWKYNFNCSRLNKACLQRSLDEKHQQESYVPFVIDAVYLAAHALSRYFKDHCTSKSFSDCKQLKTDGTKLLHYIRNTSFHGTQDEVRLNEDGDRMIRYIIYQYRRGQPDHYLPIGEWVSNELSLNKAMVKTGYLFGGLPESQCGRPCSPIEYRSTIHSTCCWECLHCNETSIRPNETSCMNCKLGQKPNSFKNVCIEIVPDTLQWTSPFALVPACFSAMGITATLFVVIVFLKHNKTPVIMASGRELCYIMLAGIFFCYLMTFAVLWPPNRATCGVQRMGLGLCLCIIYAAILTKTSRLSRIFTSNVRALQRPRFISPRAQVVICCLLVVVQLVGGIGWLIKNPPNTSPMYALNLLSMTMACEVTPKPMLISFSYIALLITLCTIYAFKTRKIPENFNETKHIGFTMYATCIIWLSFIPIYFGTNDNFKVQATSLCICLSASGTVALCCFFAPKIYIVLFQPDKNTRHHGPGSNQTSGFQKMQMTVVNQQMRFLSRPTSTAPVSQSGVGSEKQPTTATQSLFSMKSTESNQAMEASSQHSHTNLANSVSANNTAGGKIPRGDYGDNSRLNNINNNKNRSATKNKFRQFVPSIFSSGGSSASSSSRLKLLPLSKKQRKGKIACPNNSKDLIITNRPCAKLMARDNDDIASGGGKRRNSTKFSSVSTSNFSPNSVITENTPFLFSIVQNTNDNNEGRAKKGKKDEKEESKSDHEYSSVFFDQDDPSAAVKPNDVAVPSQSSRSESPDSYTEPARRNRKTLNPNLTGDNLVTTALVNNKNHNSNGNHGSEKSRTPLVLVASAAAAPTISPIKDSSPNGNAIAAVGYPKSFHQDGSKLLSSNTINHHDRQQPPIHNNPIPNSQQSDWILIDPRNEFESIISDIANREATFV